MMGGGGGACPCMMGWRGTMHDGRRGRGMPMHDGMEGEGHAHA